MNNNPVLIIGSGHLAYRVKKLVDAAGYKTIHLTSGMFEGISSEKPVFEIASARFKEIDMNGLSMVYLLDDQDERNLEMIIVLISLFKNIKIAASVFNENMAPHLQAAHPNLTIFNPAKIAAIKFVEALDEPVTRRLSYTPVQHEEVNSQQGSDKLIMILGFSFVGLLALATVYFHYAENLSLLNSLYFVIVTITTVGYGDISLVNAAPISKIAGIFLILMSTLFIWLIFSLTVDRIIKKRVRLSMGRKKYFYKDHVVVCGLGRLGYFIVDTLLKRGEKVIIIEMNENSPHINHFRHKGASVYIGNARLPTVLQDVNITKAKALFSVVSDDYANVEIGLNGRSFQPELRLILRIYDVTMAQKIKENLDIHLTLSMSAVADKKFFEVLTSVNHA